MQIIGITGSKRDLGKAIFDELTEDYHIESYNYPDFDLNDIETRKWIIEDIQNLGITIFINNSYADGGQTLLLYDLINLINSGYELQVITLNSINSTREFNDIQRLDQLKYTIDKQIFLEKQNASISLPIIVNSSYIANLDNFKSLSFIYNIYTSI